MAKQFIVGFDTGIETAAHDDVEAKRFGCVSNVQ
jgi:hypothetical protein